MRTQRRLTSIIHLRVALCAALLALGSLPGAPVAQEAAGKLQPTLEILRPFTYEGDPLLVRVAVFNTGDRPYDNAAGIQLLGGLKVVSASRGKIDLKPKGEPDAKRQPAVIAPGGFFGIIQDLAPMAPGISKAGTYTISWEASGMSADPITVKVIPKFDPAAPYVAVFETDYGYLEFDLMTKQAPKHVQNFYDLVHQGFYDNTVLHQVIRGVEIRGGDPTGAGTGWPGYSLEPEVTPETKHKRGTLSAVKMPGQSQDNGSQFVITLSSLESYDGVLSTFGQIRKGDDVLQAIESIPTSGQREIPPFRPLKPVVVRTISLKKASSSGSAGAGR